MQFDFFTKNLMNEKIKKTFFYYFFFYKNLFLLILNETCLWHTANYIDLFINILPINKILQHFQHTLTIMTMEN